MANTTPLTSYNSFENSYEIDNYPYGSLRCKKRYWIEKNKNKGERLVTCTQNPKTGKWNAPKADIYGKKVWLYLNHENNHVEFIRQSKYGFASQELANEFKAKLLELGLIVEVN